MDMEMENENKFVADDVSTLVQETIEQILGGSSYQSSKIDAWTNSVIEQVLARLTALDKAFKYMVSATLQQKTGAGLHAATSCYWDASTDGSCTIKWENKTMICAVTVFGLAV